MGAVDCLRASAVGPVLGAFAGARAGPLPLGPTLGRGVPASARVAGGASLGRVAAGGESGDRVRDGGLARARGVVVIRLVGRGKIFRCARIDRG